MERERGRGRESDTWCLSGAERSGAGLSAVRGVLDLHTLDRTKESHWLQPIALQGNSMERVGGP